jgi:hypothetical protein
MEQGVRPPDASVGGHDASQTTSSYPLVQKAFHRTFSGKKITATELGSCTARVDQAPPAHILYSACLAHAQPGWSSRRAAHGSLGGARSHTSRAPPTQLAVGGAELARPQLATPGMELAHAQLAVVLTPRKARAPPA